ncbi:hypothetical protein T03_4081 [Trichinella britovi]|uniref:Uncharacterized protein n=1 Tax=Trichinella britovi TaxID=45882 RepID=A0A0V1B7T1_TRIBR|nr:hypothetical protein T03_9060 [Trichinella britovi]KRY33130.1 hypothetical protein T03_22 [Trichinella britovi]KRY43617.1 hypothetical protein T03_4081 [Trichinella britovi]
MRFAVCMKNPERFSENSLQSEFEAALTAIRLVLSIAEYSDD